MRRDAILKRVDIFFILFFLYFFWAAWTVDIWMGLDIDLLSTGWEYHRLVHEYGRNVDPAFLANTCYFRWSALASGLLCGPLYPFLIYGLVRRRRWVILPGRIWGVLMALNMTVIFFLEFAFEPHPQQLVLFMATTGPYLIVPLLFLLRLRQPLEPAGTR